MGKQAHGIFALNMNNRVDTVSYDLCYPQVPLTQTGLERALHVDMAPYGENFNIAIASYTGYNQEDSMILNQGSVDRGLGRSLYHRTYREEEKTRGTDSSRFEKPDPENTIGMREAKYDKL
jgi:DNA-directed RNA polymerase II subunit RPB2